MLFEFQEILRNPGELLGNLLKINTTQSIFDQIPKNAVTLEIGGSNAQLNLGQNELESGPLTLLQLIGE